MPTKSNKVLSPQHLNDIAFRDLYDGLMRSDLWLSMAKRDIQGRFRRSILGPFWLTLSTGFMIAALGYVFSQLFGQTLADFLPYIALGLIYWTTLVSTITEGSTAFASAEAWIKNVPMPLSIHYFSVFMRNVMIWAFNMVIYIVVYVVFIQDINFNFLLAIPGTFLFFSIIGMIGMCLNLISTRYRDFPQIISSIMQVTFFVTPILWSVDSLPNRPAFIVLNPAYHLISIVREPLLGIAPSMVSWVVTVVIFLMLIPVVLLLYKRCYARIAYWV